MKYLPLALATVLALLASGCTAFPGRSATVATDAPAAAPRQAKATDGLAIRDEQGDVVVQKVEFHSGVSSATVERLAKRFGCTGDKGAGRITVAGPVEVYRMQCDNGTTFLAQCELRKCRPMR